MGEEDQMVEQAGEAAPAAEELPGGAPEAAADPLEALRQELEQAKAREAEYLDGWQRARAELANARRRFQREQEQVYANAKADVIVQILPIADDLERAFETLPDNLSRLTWIEGLMLIQRKLQLLLERAGVVPIPATGQEFSPLLHEAISHEPCETAPAGQIIAEFQKGYQMGERVLRPSLVRVSSGPLPQPESKPVRPAPEQEAGAETPNSDKQA